MKCIIICMLFFFLGCDNTQTVTPTESSDSAIKAIDPKGTISDTSQYPMDSSRGDSGSTGVTH